MTKTTSQRAKRGIVFTIDIALTMMLLLVMIATAYSLYGSPSRAGFDSQLLRCYVQDAATVMSIKGYFSTPTAIENGTNTSGIREVLRATSPSVCMQVSAYGTIVPDDLQGYWKFDENSGSVAFDSSGNGNAGTLAGGAGFTSIGKTSGALSLNGAGAYVNISNDSMFDLSDAGTVSLWFKTNNFTNAYPHLLSRGASSGWDTDGWSLYMFQSGLLGVGMRNGATSNALSTGGNGQLGAWKHVAATWNGTRITLYINGAYSASTAQTIVPPSTGKMMQIGRHQESAGGWFNGSIDEVRIYNRALTSDEVALLYSNPSNIIYVVDKPECTYSSGEVQTLTVPFVAVGGGDDEYYYATLRTWFVGAGK